MDIYTPVEEAGKIIRKRFEDIDLRNKVNEKLGGDVPPMLNDGPSGLIFRQICTPDGEFTRFIELCKKTNVKPTCLEYIEDKFHSGNFTKYGLGCLSFLKIIDKNNRTHVEKEMIIDFNTANGERLCDLSTFWGENLVDFHHFFLQSIYPETNNRIYDISKWVKRHGNTPKNYYFDLFSLATCYTIYFDDFDLIESEDKFINEVVIPAFNSVEAYYGVRPIIVKISNVGEHEKNPYWWCYSKESKDIMEEHKKKFI